MNEQTHWGPDPGHGGLTQHKGLRADCSGPDCGSDEGSHFHQATQRLEASDWQWQEHGFKGALREAIVAQVHSNLAVAFELRTFNSDRSQWYREVLEVLTQAKDGDGSLRSEQPEAALRCDVCGRPGDVARCIIGPLTRDQWKAHWASLYQRSMDNGGYRIEATRSANTTMQDRFGPCPEES